ncbi:MAG: hypothetical protein ABL866_04175 [Devosia sp.]
MQTIVDAFIDAFDAFYKANQQSIDRKRYMEECATSLSILKSFLTIPPAGFIKVSYADYLGYEKLAHIIERVKEPFSVPLTDAYKSHPLMKLNKEGYWELDKPATRELERMEKKEIDNIGEERFAFYASFKNSIFYPPAIAHKIVTAFEQQANYNFSDQARFRHQWVVGNHGTGKTTYLSNLILTDLGRVEAGEASLIIIDSQNELIPDLAQSAYCAPGKPLHDKLIYLEPDPLYPLALNIFDIQSSHFKASNATERETIVRGAMQLTQFFLASIVQMDTTAHMDTILGHLVPAVMSIKDATIFTMQKLVEPGGFDALKHELHIDPEEMKWLETRLPAPEYKQTVGALRARLDAFAADPLFKRMFRNPRSKLDLFTELQSSKLILINTNRGLLKGATEAFGRFFIAKLLQATEERMLVDKNRRLPVFCYIDEATDYIAREENIRELTDKARKQMVSLTLAAQAEENVQSATVLSALRRMAIQTRLRRTGQANIEVDSTPLTATIPDFNFANGPHMSKVDWESTLARMHERYCVEVTGSEPTIKPPLVTTSELMAEASTDDEIKPSKVDW